MEKKSITGERLIKLRNEKKLNQEDIAKVIGFHRAKVSKFETGEKSIDIESLKILANYYGTTTDYILGISDVRSLDIEIEKISRYTGLTEDAIKLLHELAQQNSGESVSDTCKKKIEKIEKQFNDSENVSEIEECDKNEQIEIAKSASKSIAESQLSALNYILTQDETQRFLTDLFLHLFSEVKDNEDIMSAIITLKSKESQPEDKTQIEKGFYFNLLDYQINGLFLLEINSILNKWKSEPCAEIVDINTENNDWISEASDV